MPTILFRRSLEMEEEYNALITTDWKVCTHLLELPRNDLIIGRYSVLPFYQEVEEELKLINCELINTYNQHRYIADIENWYNDLREYTPETWFVWNGLPDCSFVVKGRTNSRKFNWDRQMFAATRNDVPRIVYTLMDDSMIRDQSLCVRRYVPLRRFDVGINGLPVTNEWRIFFYKNTLLAGGYYWANFEDCKPYEFKDLPKQAFDLLRVVSNIVSAHTNFFVVDIAETESGDWIVIELNDGGMSGLSMIDPLEMYRNLSAALTLK
jgi:hypothetical protein